jgi:tRNA(fMet)-specific endonuclease VapC
MRYLLDTGHLSVLQLAKMDARIAAIALFRGLILLIHNHQDFGKVAGLPIEDWTV